MNRRRHLLGWLALPFLAVANGLVRDFTYGRPMDRDLAHSIAVAPLIALILLWTWVLARRWPLASRTAAWTVGTIWLLLTLAFEFGLGALQGMPLRMMLTEYDVTQGRLWPLVPFTVLVAPVLLHEGRRAG
jgi:hypothetical protein